MASIRWAVSRSAEVAAATMTLTQTLGENQDFDYAGAFKDEQFAEIIRAVARAHVATGDAKAALAWASRIGSDEKIPANDEHSARNSVENRINALLGVAEGILDKGRDSAVPRK